MQETKIAAILLLLNLTHPVLAQQPAAAEWQAKFNQTYKLADGQNVKYIQPPFIAAREEIAAIGSATRPAAYKNPDAMLLDQQPDGTFTVRYRLPGHPAGRAPRGMSIRVVAVNYSGIKALWTVQGDKSLLDQTLPGDWVMRAGASEEDIFFGIAGELNALLAQHLSFVHEPVEHDVVVANAPFPLKKAQASVLGQRMITLKDGGRQYRFFGGGPVFELLELIYRTTGYWTVNDDPATSNAVVPIDMPVLAKEAINDNGIDAMTAELAKSTGLTFKREKRTVKVWTLKIAP